MLKQTIKVGDVLYIVERVVLFREGMNIQDWKDWIGASHSFKKDNHIYFVNEIEVIEYVDVELEVK
jgi:hypothetical protein